MKCRICAAAFSEGALFCGNCGSSVIVSRLRPPDVADPRPTDTSTAVLLAKPAVAGRFPSSVELDDDGLPPTEAMDIIPIESAPPVAQMRGYRLNFSTGESVGVDGSGLVGRRPITQPGEHIDQLVAISDPARSVSKTHLEFGVEGGDFWICDRYSGNGSFVRSLDGVVRQCEAGRRYRVSRGMRVDIGDQWFDVS